MNHNPVIAVEIGGTKLQAALGSSDGAIIERRRSMVARDQGAAGILDWCAAQAAELLANGHGETQAAAIGIGFGGPVETATGRALVSHQVAGWENLPIKRWFEERFNLPVIVANDANAAGWAEYCLGAGRGTRNFVYMNIGSGIGGALVVEGCLYDGQGRGACEIGHSWVPDWTATAPGAADKLEHLCSGWAIEQRLRAMTYIEADTPLHVLCGGKAERLNCALLAEAARRGDPCARAEIAQVVEAVGVALGNVIALFHPERIALGGGVSLMGEVLFTPLRAALNKRMFAPYASTVELVPCLLEEDVVVAGALLLAGALVAG